MSGGRLSAALRYTIWPVVGALFVAGCGASSDGGGPTSAASKSADTSSASVTLDSATVATLDRTVADAFASSGLPGLAVSVWIGDEEWAQVLGVADIASSKPYESDDHGRIASISKTFTATAILQQVGAGKLALDDTLESFVPGLPNGSKITVRNLLDMTSGLYDFTADEAFNVAFDADPVMPWTPQQAVDIVKAHPVDFEPGAKTVYCDSNYILLGLILEKVTGRTAAAVINDDVVAKLGMSGTNFPTGNTVPEPHPTAYLPDPNDPGKPLRIVDDVNPAVGWTAGAMTSTIEDLKLWAKELTDGSLLTPELQRERLASKKIDGMPINLGYGLGVMTINDLVGHNGAILGYSSIVLRLPEADATFVAIGNASTDSTTVTTDIVLKLIEQLYPEQLK
ncbi:serine hydrolase [Antrihabitans sp. YC2-6]|uniref:serine hydrolase domain-containing protein n=1 Tax=Antrihabitans sp. YC2-6 TaxID=2799498 RepID=UPI0018F7BC69|nr:serine hydrolase domain-containing protein [Antrihabitans sp. YC2-6]MBJ8344823.1 beta-lactamase family protein [Antrihabitans sp. YC2-6]